MVQAHIKSLIAVHDEARSDPQNLLTTLLGDFWSGQEAAIPSGALVELLAIFGVSESSSRQTMRRLTARDLLVLHKSGRNTRYQVPERIRARSKQRRARNLTYGDVQPEKWDGEWTFALFSIPESNRDIRQLLRESLRKLNFGLLTSGVWFSPRDLSKEVGEIYQKLNVTDGKVIRGRFVAPELYGDMLENAYELASLRLEYDEFIETYEPVMTDPLIHELKPEQALILRTRLMNDWLAFRKTDPEIPTDLLPSDWPRARARKCFEAVYNGLSTPAASCFRSIINKHETGLGDLTTRYTTLDPTKPSAN